MVGLEGGAWAAKSMIESKDKEIQKQFLRMVGEIMPMSAEDYLEHVWRSERTNPKILEGLEAQVNALREGWAQGSSMADLTIERYLEKSSVPYSTSPQAMEFYANDERDSKVTGASTGGYNGVSIFGPGDWRVALKDTEVLKTRLVNKVQGGLI